MPESVTHSPSEIPLAERVDRETLVGLQGRRLVNLLGAIQGRNAFSSRKLDQAGIRRADLGGLRFPADLGKLPLTTKTELVADQEAAPPWGTVLTEPMGHYTRYNQTSATTGRPLRWL